MHEAVRRVIRKSKGASHEADVPFLLLWGHWLPNRRATKKGSQVSSRRPWRNFTIEILKSTFLMVRNFILLHFLPLQIRIFHFLMVKISVSAMFVRLNQAFEPLFMANSSFLYHCKSKNRISHGKNPEPHKNFTIANVQNRFLMVKSRIHPPKMSTNKENPYLLVIPNQTCSKKYFPHIFRRTFLYSSNLLTRQITI